MNTQCMMEVRDRDRLLDPENGTPTVMCSRWTEWDRCSNEGSIILQMKGGKNLCKRASIIILEVSLVELNEGAPIYDEVVGLMNDFGFEERMSIGEHYEEDEIIQKDLVFLNKDRLE